MSKNDYFMETREETLRLERKTDDEAVEKQALWAGIRPGMRVVDLGCGPGRTTRCLSRLVKPGGMAVGLDLVEERLEYARANYSDDTVTYIQADARNPLETLGTFDLVWIRFLLEYYRKESFEIVQNAFDILKPGGILCLIDLDHNCLSHYGLPDRLERAYTDIMDILVEEANFDPYVGRKLYAFLYDVGCSDIDVNMFPHHLIFGPLKETDRFNWTCKVRGAVKRSGYRFDGYEGGYKAFYREFIEAFSHPRRFTYTPLICCRGKKPFDSSTE